MKASLYLRNKREAKGKGARRDESASALEDYLQGQGMDEVAARRCRLRLDAMANDGKSPMEIEAVLRAEIKEFKALAELLEGEPDHEGFAGIDADAIEPRDGVAAAIAPYQATPIDKAVSREALELFAQKLRKNSLPVGTPIQVFATDDEEDPEVA